jgi:hypothetical protein
MIETKEEYKELLKRLQNLDSKNKLSKHLKSKLEGLEECENLILFGVSRSIGEVKDKFGIIKTSEKPHPNICELCKYKGQDALSDECNWCLNNYNINQYYG